MNTDLDILREDLDRTKKVVSDIKQTMDQSYESLDLIKKAFLGNMHDLNNPGFIENMRINQREMRQIQANLDILSTKVTDINAKILFLERSIEGLPKKSDVELIKTTSEDSREKLKTITIWGMVITSTISFLLYWAVKLVELLYKK